MNYLKYLTLTAAILLSSFYASAQTCGGSFIFTSQAEVDNFPINNPGCTEILGGVDIGGADITNLDGLAGVTSIGGAFFIGNNPVLTDLTGLASLTSVGGYLEISDNATLTSLSGLGALASIGGELFIAGNDALSSLGGLTGLTAINGALIVSSNPALTSLIGLDNIDHTTITYLYIQNSSSLSTCDVPSICDYLAIPGNGENIFSNATGCNDRAEVEAACSPTCGAGGLFFASQNEVDDFPTDFPGCTQIIGSVTVTGADIANLDGLSPVTTISSGSLYLDGNPILTDLTGLGSLTSISGQLFISNNATLTGLTGLNALTSVGTNLQVNDNAALANLNGLNAVASVGLDFSITSNPQLSDLTALNALGSIGGVLTISDNDALTSLVGLGNISPATITDLNIHNSALLSTCDVMSICDYLATPGSTALIFGNATGCADRPEVEASCTTSPTCGAGGITLSSQMEVDDFQADYPGCVEVLGNLTISGADIDDLSGLSPVTTIGGALDIFDNPSLPNLTGLGSLASVSGALNVYNNASLLNFVGLDNLASVGGNFYAGNDASLQNFVGLGNLATVGGYFYAGPNAAQVDFTGLSSLASVGSRFWVYDNPSLTSMAGLNSLTTTGGASMRILNNPALTNLSGLSNLTAHGSALIVSGNASLPNLTGLNGLTIGGTILIEDNAAMTSLTGLENISPATITNLTIQNSSLLSVCELPNICDYLAVPTNPATISGNATGCSTRAEVEAACAAAQFCGAGGLNFTNQASIDNFPTDYPGCTQILGSVFVSGPGITNLNGLTGVTSIGGSLTLYQNPALNSITGLSSLTEIGGFLDIENNGALPNLDALSGISAIPGNLDIKANFVLSSITGLGGVTTVSGYINIFNNPQLASLTGLGGITTVPGLLYVDGNNSLSNLTGLGGITSVGSHLSISQNGALTSLGALASLASIGGNLSLNDNAALTDFTGLEGLGAVPGYMSIQDNPSLMSLEGLNSLGAVSGYLLLDQNEALANLNGLDALSTVGGNLTISNHPALTSLAAMDGLTAIGGALTVSNIDGINSLTGLHNIDPNSISNLIVENSDVLYACDMPNICIYLSDPTNTATISSNFNQCDTRSDIEAACSTCGESGITISSQQGIDDFQLNYPFCTVILGDLTVSGVDITALAGPGTGLSVITNIVGSLTISNNPILPSLSSMANLVTLGGALTISNNDALTSLDGLQYIDHTTITNLVLESSNTLAICDLTNLCDYLDIPANPYTISGNATGCNTVAEVQAACYPSGCGGTGIFIDRQYDIDNFALHYPGCTTIPGFLQIQGPDISNLNGLSMITDIEKRLSLSFTSLTNSTGLNALESIGGDLYVDGNSDLTNFDGLGSLNTIGEDLIVFNNDELSNMTGLNSLTSIGAVVDIDNNNSLANFNGMESLNSIGTNLFITNNYGVTNLSGLNALATIGADLYIDNNSSLIDMQGLNSLTSIGGIFLLWNNNELSSLEGLNALGSIGSNLWVFNNDALLNLQGLENLSAIGGIQVNNNSQLMNLNGLSSLTSTNYMAISNNSNLQNLMGLESLISCGGNFNIEQNPVLVNLVGLNSLATIGGTFDLRFNNGLLSLNGLDALTSIGDNLDISFNPALTDLSGLEALTTIGYDLAIHTNSSITSLNGLEALTSIAHSLFINEENSLTDLTALNNLNAVSFISIINNDALTSLSGLDNIDPASIDNIYLENSALLSTCEVQSICDYLAGPGPASISGNATGCNSVAEVEAECLLVFPIELLAFTAEPSGSAALLHWRTASEQHSAYFEIEHSMDGSSFASIGRVAAAGNSTAVLPYQFTHTSPLPGTNYYRLGMTDLDGHAELSQVRALQFGGKQPGISIFPNPTDGKLTLRFGEALAGGCLVQVSDAQGRLIFSESMDGEGVAERQVGLSRLPAGVYTLRVTGGQQQFFEKIVKQ